MKSRPPFYFSTDLESIVGALGERRRYFLILSALTHLFYFKTTFPSCARIGDLVSTGWDCFELRFWGPFDAAIHALQEEWGMDDHAIHNSDYDPYPGATAPEPIDVEDSVLLVVEYTVESFLDYRKANSHDVFVQILRAPLEVAMEVILAQIRRQHGELTPAAINDALSDSRLRVLENEWRSFIDGVGNLGESDVDRSRADTAFESMRYSYFFIG